MDEASTTAALREALQEAVERGGHPIRCAGRYRATGIDPFNACNCGLDELLAATEAVREPAVREPAVREPAVREPEVSSLIAHTNDHGPGCAICEAQVLRGRAAIASDAPALREHEGRDAEVAGPPQIDVERLAVALQASFHSTAYSDHRGNRLTWDELGPTAQNAKRRDAASIAATLARLASTDKPAIDV